MQEDGSYIGVVGNNVVKLTGNSGNFDIVCNDYSFVNEYFDFERDYSKIKSRLSSSDDVLKKAIPSGYGIRILKQNPWETLVSFIISSNNNIPRIKKIIESMCINFGDEIVFEGKSYFTFPSAKKINSLEAEDIDVIKSGFRAKYILDAAKKVSSGTVDLNLIYSMDTNSAREYLKQIKGVGNKVADCILLFAYQKFDVFPKDVWIKKVLNNLYGIEEQNFDSFVSEHFGNNAGFAQQYLFYFMRG